MRRQVEIRRQREHRGDRQKEPKGGMEEKECGVGTDREGLQMEGTGMESGVLNT